MIEVTTKGFDNLKSSVEVRNKILHIYKMKYQGKKKVLNNDLKIVVQFDRKGANKTSHGSVMFPEKACLIKVLGQLIKKAKFHSLGERKETDPEDLIFYMNFYLDVSINGIIRKAKIVIRFKKGGHFHYTLNVEDL